MPTNQEISLTLYVSSQLGQYAGLMSDLLPSIEQAIKLVQAQGEAQPENPMVAIMLSLMTSGRDLILAHQRIERTVEVMQTGGMHHQGPDSVQ